MRGNRDGQLVRIRRGNDGAAGAENVVQREQGCCCTSTTERPLPSIAPDALAECVQLADRAFVVRTLCRDASARLRSKAWEHGRHRARARALQKEATRAAQRRASQQGRMRRKQCVWTRQDVTPRHVVVFLRLLMLGWCLRPQRWLGQSWVELVRPCFTTRGCITARA